MSFTLFFYPSSVPNFTFSRIFLSSNRSYPNVGTIEYPLGRRGLVLIRGQSADGSGADSNGAGKTTLVCVKCGIVCIVCIVV